jgi:hypothetical protein
MKVLEEKEEKIGAGSLLVPGHTYANFAAPLYSI